MQLNITNIQKKRKNVTEKTVKKRKTQRNGINNQKRQLKITKMRLKWQQKKLNDRTKMKTDKIIIIIIIIKRGDKNKPRTTKKKLKNSTEKRHEMQQR